MGGLQLPVDRLAAALTPRIALALATFVAAAGYLVMALPLGFSGLCLGLILAGAGSSLQHPRASLLVTNTYGKASRGPLGIYNFAGDLGKATFPAIVALLLPIVAWRPLIGLMALIGLVVSASLLVLIPQQSLASYAKEDTRTKELSARGFNLLFAIGACDTATRMGYLLFLPFLLHAKGGRRRATSDERLRCSIRASLALEDWRQSISLPRSDNRWLLRPLPVKREPNGDDPLCKTNRPVQ
jgi:MFS transporter, FSR family, fosmidomycin resistance protein